MEENVERGSGIFIEESWRIEVKSDGGALVTIYTTIKNVSEKEQSLNEPYELRFRTRDQPDDFHCGSHTITGDNSIPLNLKIPPFSEEKITIDLGYTNLAKREDSWWDISLDPRYGVLSPHNLTIKIYLPMEAQEIMDRHPIPEDFLINHEHRTAVKTFTGSPSYFFKLAYRLGTPETGLEERTREPLSEDDLRAVREAMPLLQTFANNLSKEQGGNLFNGMTFLIALHFLKDLIVFLESCKKLGLEPENCYLFWKDYLYPYKAEIISYLQGKGYKNVYLLDDLENVLESQQESMNNVLVLEDGGYIVPLLHKSFRNILEKTVGAVEQTTKGIRRDKEIADLAIPVLNVAEAEIKKRVEPPFVANAAVHNIEGLLPSPLQHMQIALMGLGAIGGEILEILKHKANITVYDPDPIRRIEARTRGITTVKEAYNAVREKHLVIGCSGEPSITEYEILSLSHDTYLVSVSSDQVEIDIKFLINTSTDKKLYLSESRKIGTSYDIQAGGRRCTVHLLADGYPVNFWYKESMPNQVSDLILSIILLSALELAKNDSKYTKGFQDIDEIVKKYRVAESYESRYYP